MAKQVWLGTPPSKCDLCRSELTTDFMDAKTRFGPWGMLCPACHSAHGYGLGAGRGQHYRLNPKTQKWEKVGG